MSDCVQLPLMSSSSTATVSFSQPSNTNSIRKQASSKLVNRYLSTAAQYLNRSKSFHIPSSTPHNNNQSRSIIPCHDRHFFFYHADLPQRSIPMNINRIKPSDLVDVDDDPQQLVTYPSSSIDLEHKSHGFVNTLRRSLRKNKERISSKSSHSLHQNETNTPHPTLITMTPTLRPRHVEPCSWLTTPKTRSNSKMNIVIESNIFAQTRCIYPVNSSL